MNDQLKNKEKGIHDVDKTNIGTMQSNDIGNRAVTTDLSRQYASVVMKYVEACPTMLDAHVALLARKIDELLRTVKDSKDKDVQMHINAANNTLQQLLEHHRSLKDCFNFSEHRDIKTLESDNQTKVSSTETTVHDVTPYIDSHVVDQKGAKNSKDNDRTTSIISKEGPLSADNSDIAITISNHTKSDISDDVAISPPQLPVLNTQEPTVKKAQGVPFEISDINQYIAQKLPLDLSQFKQKDHEMFRSCKSRFEQLIEKHKLGPVSEVLSIYQFIKSLNSVMIQRKIHGILRSYLGAQDLDTTHTTVPDSWQKFNEILSPYEDSLEDGFKQLYLQQKLTDEQKQTEDQNKEVVAYHPTTVEYTAPFISWVYQSITAMPKYNHISFEELRLQDYKHRKKVYNFRDDFTCTPAEDFDGTWYTYHSLSAMSNKNLQRTSFEELRVRQYRQMHKRLKKFPLSTFEPTIVPEDNAETDYLIMYSITAMNEYQHLSVEEIRLQDYHEGRGPPPVVAYNDISPTSIDTPSSTLLDTPIGAVFGKVSPLATPYFGSATNNVPSTFLSHMPSTTTTTTAFGLPPSPSTKSPSPRFGLPPSPSTKSPSPRFGHTSALNSNHKPFTFKPQYDASKWTISKPSGPAFSSSSSTSDWSFAFNSPPANFFLDSSSSTLGNSNSPSAGTFASSMPSNSFTIETPSITTSSNPLDTTGANNKPDELNTTVSINNGTDNASVSPK